MSVPPAPASSVSRPLAVGLGEVLWDLLPAGKQLGGAPANFACHAQQLGADGVVVSAIGDDALGAEIRERLAAAGLRFACTLDSRHLTGTVSVQLDAQGVPSYIIHEPVAWDFLRVEAGETMAMFQAQADVVCFGTLAQRAPVSRESIQRYLRETRPQQCLRIFDINLRQHYYSEAVIRESLELASVLKLNEQELPVVARLLGFGGAGAGEGGGGMEQEVIARLLRDFSLRLVALTRGDKGSSLYAPDAQDHHAGVRTRLVDTVGAGDAFTAAVAIGLLRGEPLARINDAANRLAAYVCSQPGATPAIPRELLETLWPGS